MLRQVANDALGVRIEASREWNLLSQRFLENLVCVIVHEGWHTDEKLIHEDAKRVPVCGSSMPDVHDDLRRHVLRCAAQCVSALPWLDLLDKAEVSQLHVAIVLEKNILRLEIPVD